MAYILVIIFGLIAWVSSIAVLIYSKWNNNPANHCEVIDELVYCNKVPYTGNIVIKDSVYKWVYQFYIGTLGAISMQMTDGARVTYTIPHFDLWKICDSRGQKIDKRLFEDLYKVKVKDNAGDALVLLVDKYEIFRDIVY